MTCADISRLCAVLISIRQVPMKISASVTHFFSMTQNKSHKVSIAGCIFKTRVKVNVYYLQIVYTKTSCYRSLILPISYWISKLLYHHLFLEAIPSNTQSRDPSPGKDCIAFSLRLSPFHLNLSLTSADGLVFSRKKLRAQHRP